MQCAIKLWNSLPQFSDNQWPEGRTSLWMIDLLIPVNSESYIKLPSSGAICLWILLELK